MDFVSTKKTLLILITTLIVAVSIPTSVYLFRSGYFDIRNQASEEVSDTTEVTETVDEKAEFNEGLMAQWNFNEYTGTEVSEETTYDNIGTLSGFDETDSRDQNVYSGWTEDNALYDGALMFDGDDDFMSMEDDDSLDVEELTISVWFKTEEDGYLVSKFQSTDSKYGYALRIGSDVLSCWVGDDEWVTGEIEVTDGEWHNGVCTYDGTSVKIYVDGDLDLSELQNANTMNSISLTIGAFDLGSSGHFQGIIDCVQIYDNALSFVTLSNNLDEEDFEATGLAVEETTDTSEEESPTADIDGDGDIGVNDYYLFTGDYDSYSGGGVAVSRSDFDQDGDIDMEDYTLFFEEYSLD